MLKREGGYYYLESVFELTFKFLAKFVSSRQSESRCWSRSLKVLVSFAVFVC